MYDFLLTSGLILFLLGVAVTSAGLIWGKMENIRARIGHDAQRNGPIFMIGIGVVMGAAGYGVMQLAKKVKDPEAPLRRPKWVDDEP